MYAFDETSAIAAMDVETIRQDFPALAMQVRQQPLVYLDNAATTQKPQQVIDAISHYYETQNANVHRSVHYLSEQATAAFEGVREQVRAFINAPQSHEIIFTSGTTDSINLLASSFAQQYLQTGDEVLVTDMEHHSNIVPWQMVCEQRGARLQSIPVSDTGELQLDRLDEYLNERVRIVALTHVSNSLGTINPVADIIRMAHERDIPVLLDGAQAMAHMRVDVRALDVDFYAFSAHKMFGPTGVGVLYGKSHWLESLPPYQSGGEMIESVSMTKSTFAELPYKFEAGTPNIAGVIGLGAVINYLQKLDASQVKQHEQALLHYARDELQQIIPCRVIGTAENKVPIVSFLLGEAHPYDVGVILDQMGVAIRTGHHCTQPLMQRFEIPGTVRASFAFYNTRQEVDRLIEAVNRARDMLS